MFDLSAADLAGGVLLDCSAGGSSFAAESGADLVVAVDPAYALDRDELVHLVRSGLREGDAIIAAHADRFDWSWYGTPAHRAQLRFAAAERFADDMRANPGRYVAASLPDLPFAAGSFDMVVCSHLLFTWADHLDVEWHRQALTELVRVSRREVRVFPLVVQGTGEPVPFLEELRADLAAAGHRTHLRRVAYRFQRGADRMLTIERRASGRPTGSKRVEIHP